MYLKDSPLVIGKIVSITGSVVDIEFSNLLPAIYTLVYTGRNKEIAIEVLSQLDSKRVRGIALTPTQGLARGMLVESTGKQLSVPIGENIMGRMFDVFGNTIDHGEPLKNFKRKSIHQSPPSLSEPVVQKLLPLDQQWKEEFLDLTWPTAILPQVAGSKKNTLLALIHEFLFSSLFKACAESLASENASRLLAMQRAEKNIDELVDHLKQQYHQLRQGLIDEELFDVISGFKAIHDDQK